MPPPLITFLLTLERFNKEKTIIREADVNKGYSNKVVDHLTTKIMNERFKIFRNEYCNIKINFAQIDISPTQRFGKYSRNEV